eukprot:g13190.t1
MDTRDRASVAFHAALARCSGAADEARRRGLFEVAEMLMPSDTWCGFHTLRPKTAEDSTRPVTTSSGVEVWTLGKDCLFESTTTRWSFLGWSPCRLVRRPSLPLDALIRTDARRLRPRCFRTGEAHLWRRRRDKVDQLVNGWL